MAELQRPRDFLKVMWGSQFVSTTPNSFQSVGRHFVLDNISRAHFMIFKSRLQALLVHLRCLHDLWLICVLLPRPVLKSGMLGQGPSLCSGTKMLILDMQIAYQGLSTYGWQTVCNMLAVITGIIAATLYGNIGIKVVYNNILIDLFNFPPLTTKRGKQIWAVIVPLFWSLAFILSAAIPDFFGLTSLTAALLFVQFTYTYPGLLGLGYLVQKEAMRGETTFDPYTGELQRRDSGIKRVIRGFFGRYWWACILLTLYTMGGLVVSALGTYSSIESLIAAFQTPQVNAFTCTSPLA